MCWHDGVIVRSMGCNTDRKIVKNDSVEEQQQNSEVCQTMQTNKVCGFLGDFLLTLLGCVFLRIVRCLFSEAHYHAFGARESGVEVESRLAEEVRRIDVNRFAHSGGPSERVFLSMQTTMNKFHLVAPVTKQMLGSKVC